ncbi:MAG: T9SS type A sorting domain-containing protein [Candidatus Eisenbacteria bacterium]
MMRHLCLFAALLCWVATASAQVLRDDLWVTNGGVYASTVVGNTLFLGGTFSRVGPATGGLMPVHATTGNPAQAPPLVDGSINAIVSDGAGGWYVGGAFRHIQGLPRNSLARISSSGEVKAWNPNVIGTVNAMLLSGGKVYLGGQFSQVGGQGRNNLAAVDTTTGVVVAGWNPNANSSVNALGIATGLVYVGGAFTTIAGVSRLHVAALDATTGAASPWQPNPNGDVYALAVNYDVINLTTFVYMGGSFSLVFGFPRANFAHVDATPASATFNQPTAFNPSPNGTVRSVVISGRTIILTYLGGDFTTIAGQPRARLASLSGTTLGSWNPGADNTVVSLRLSGSTMYVGGYFGTLGGQARPFGGAVATSGGAATAWNPQPNAPVRMFALIDTTVWMGGDFTSLGGVARANLAALDLTTGMATGWNPGANGTVYALEQVLGLLYAGGAFTTVGGQSRAHVAQLDVNGAVGAWDPAPDGDVRAIASRSGGSSATIFLGGKFANVMNTARNRLAAVSDAVSPSLSSWNPNPNGQVDAIVVDPQWVYVAGQFSGFAGLYSRQYVAQLDANGVPTAFLPNPSKPIRALALVGSKLYLGFAGQATVGGQTRHGIAATAPPANTVLPWDPQCDGSVYAILPSGGTLYLGGFFSHMGGQPRENLAQVDTALAATASSFNAPTWSFQSVYVLGADPPGVFDLAESGGKLFAAGLFTSILSKPHSGIGGMFTSTVGVEPLPVAGLALRATPNPARGSQALEFTLPTAGAVRIEIHSVAGRLVRAFSLATLSAGLHRITWDGEGLAPGIFFVTLQTATERTHTKVLRLE